MSSKTSCYFSEEIDIHLAGIKGGEECILVLLMKTLCRKGWDFSLIQTVVDRLGGREKGLVY